MEKIKNLVTITAVVYLITFLDGVFGWDLANGFYVTMGLTQIVCILWLLLLVYKKQ